MVIESVSVWMYVYQKDTCIGKGKTSFALYSPTVYILYYIAHIL